jgi:hypothetical protein
VSISQQAIVEVIYLREILRGFNCAQTEPIVIFEHNQSCIAMSENQVHHKHSRHIDVQKYSVRDLVDDKAFKLIHCKTYKMVVDDLTKSLSYPSSCQDWGEPVALNRAGRRGSVCLGG